MTPFGQGPRTPLRRSPMKRGGKRIKPRNAKRRQTEFARCYHSRARVAWVKSLGCVYCAAISPFFHVQTVGKCDNAHTEGGGTARKAGYETIVPLCRSHHRMYDEHRMNEAERAGVKSLAPKIEAMWQRAHPSPDTRSTAA